jgi:hypothetical protein
MSQNNLNVMIKRLTLDQTTEVYKYYVKGQIFHTRTTYDSESNPDSDLYVHENLMDLLPTTEYEINGIDMSFRHRIFDNMEDALPFIDELENIGKIKKAILVSYNIFTTAKTGHPKFDNKMRKIGDKLRNKLLSLQ